MRPTKKSLQQRSVRRLITSLFALIAIQQVALSAELPRIVVYITIEDLRGDYLQELRPLFEGKGLEWMLTEGKLYQH